MKSIVAGVDDSPSARAAADEAAALAKVFACPLHLVTAYRPAPPTEIRGGGDDRWTVTSLDLAEKLLEEVAGGLSAGPGITVAAIAGSPAEVILEEAQRLGADLIVVGNKRMHGAARVLGAVADRVAHHAPCSVYIAKTT